MKNKKIGIIVIALAIVGFGSLLFYFSTNKIMADTQEHLSEQKELVSNQKETVVEVPSNADGEVQDQVEKKREMEQALVEQKMQDRAEQLELELALLEQRRVEIAGEMVERRAEISFVHCGQNVYVLDSLMEKDIAKENGIIIMDFIFDYVDQKIFTPYEIDKTAYTYEIQRQYEEDGIHYGVFMKQQDRIKCTIGIDLNGEPVLTSFARSGLVNLCGQEKEIPEEYLVKNWCNTQEKKDAIYNEYYEASKEIIENVLGLSPIKEEMEDENRYFSADDGWSTVVFGYELEDGTYIKVFYNRVNQMWDGFVIEEISE